MRASGRDIDRASGSGYKLKEISDAKDLDQGNGAEPLFAERDSDQRICHKTDAQSERRTHKKDHGKNIDKHIVQAFDVVCELGIPWVMALRSGINRLLLIIPAMSPEMLKTPTACSPRIFPKKNVLLRLEINILKLPRRSHLEKCIRSRHPSKVIRGRY